MNSKTTCTKVISLSKKELQKKLGIEGEIKEIYVTHDWDHYNITGIQIDTIVSEKEEKE